MLKGPPPELLVLLAVAAVVAAGLLLAAHLGGRLHPWVVIEQGFGIFLMVGMTVAATIQVVIRYGMSEMVALPWTEELSRLLLVWASFWGAAALQRADDHIAMTLVYDLFPQTLKLGVRLFGDLICLGVSVLIVWYSWQVVEVMVGMASPSLGVSAAVFTLSVLISTALMVIHTGACLARRIATGRPDITHTT